MRIRLFFQRVGAYPAAVAAHGWAGGVFCHAAPDAGARAPRQCGGHGSAGRPGVPLYGQPVVGGAERGTRIYPAAHGCPCRHADSVRLARQHAACRPSGTTTLAAAYLAAGPARAAQLLGIPLVPPRNTTLRPRPAAMPAFGEQGTTVRLDMAALQEDTDPHQNSVAEIEAPLPRPLCVIWGQSRLMPEQPGCWQLYTAALFRQNPQQLAALPGQARQASARILTDLQAQDWNTLESVFNYFSTVPALVVETALPSLISRPEGELAPDGKRAADGAGGAEDGEQGNNAANCPVGRGHLTPP